MGAVSSCVCVEDAEDGGFSSVNTEEEKNVTITNFIIVKESNGRACWHRELGNRENTFQRVETVNLVPLGDHYCCLR